MPLVQPVSYRARNRYRWLRYWRAIWRDTRALWREFRTPLLAFLLVTVVGGLIYGYLHEIRYPDEPIALIDRPYIMFQLMILETPPYYDEAPPYPELVIFWYLLPPIFIFIVGNGVADFVRLFFNRSERRDAWREAVASTYRNHVIVLGAGHVGLRVVEILHDTHIDVVVIDNSPEAHIEDELASLKVPLIRGDGRNSNVLEKAGIRYAESFVACTGNDHLNLDAIMRARYINADIRIVVRVWDDTFATQIKAFMNVQSVLSSSGLSAPAFAGLALGVEIAQTIEIAGEEYSTVRVTVNEQSFMDGLSIDELQDQYDMDIVLHQSRESVKVQPYGEKRVQAGDTLVIFAQHSRCLDVATRNRYLK